MGAQADMVRTEILRQIMSRTVLPGDRIDEDDLKDRLSVSVTPIREALISLETTGVIERRPRSGARVATLDTENVIKMVEALAEMEGSVAALAARRINKAQIHALREAAKDCIKWVKTPQKLTGYYDRNLDFHRALLAAASNEHLAESIMRLANRLVAYLDARHSLPGEAERSAAEHQDICNAIADGDGGKARELMMRHVNFTEVSAIDVMNALKAWGRQ